METATMNVPIEEAEQPLLTPEEVAANLAARNSEADRVDMEVGENLNVDLNPTERVGTSPIEGVETNLDVTEMREIVIVTDEEDETEKVPPSEEAAETRAVAVRTYQRRPAREETSGRRSEGGLQGKSPGQNTGGYVDSPTRSAAGGSVRRRRLIMDEETEEEEDILFTPIDDLVGRKRTDTPAEAAGNEQESRERKRKGKAIATPAKKKPRQASSTLVVRERNPTVGEDETESEEDEALRSERRSKKRHDEVRGTSKLRPEVARMQFEKIHIRLDDQLLRRMTRFRDSKMDEECDGRIGTNKKARSGKQLHQPSLHTIKGEEEFLEYITGIGFEWLLHFEMPSIPVELAKEFFTSFCFKTTTNLDERSISFRMFTREMRMSIREWSVRLGLYTADQEVEWFGRDIGLPKESPEFDQQAAWELLTPAGTAEFQPTLSRADCIKYPILRLAQVFLGYNLLGQANTSSTVTEAELYFMWCMKKQRKVHLGYWVARTCHSMAIRASRHLNICHILGALTRNCFEMSIERGIPRLTYCPSPELFNTDFFVNVNVMTRKGGKLHFYKVTRPRALKSATIERETEAATSTPQALIEAAAPEPHARQADQEDGWKARIEGLLERLAQNADAQTKLQTTQLELQIKHQEEVRAAVYSVREMVSLMARHIVPQRQGASPSTAQGAGSRRPLRREESDPRTADPRRDQPRR